MSVRVVGAGLPRTGTHSLKVALEQLLGGPCYHMSVIPGHPTDLGPAWRRALSGGRLDADEIFRGFVAAVDWPASAFWREHLALSPDSLVLLSTRDSAETWWESLEATVLGFARAQGPAELGDLRDLLVRFTGTTRWDNRSTLMAAYERQVAEVRATVRPDRLIEWHPGESWTPLCDGLGLDVPHQPFPWRNRRADWG
jgi:hypothetical protein